MSQRFVALLLPLFILLFISSAYAATKITKYVIPAGNGDSVSTPTNCSAAPVFKYYVTNSPAPFDGTFYAPDFNDSSWLEGATPIGDSTQYASVCTDVPFSDPTYIYVRKHFQIDGIPTYATIYVAFAGGAKCWVNGHLIFDRLDRQRGAYYWTYVRYVDADYLVNGDNVLACVIKDQHTGRFDEKDYFDVALRVRYTSNEYYPLLVSAPAVAQPNSTIHVTAILDAVVDSNEIPGQVTFNIYNSRGELVATVDANRDTSNKYVADITLPALAGLYIIDANGFVDDSYKFYGSAVVYASYESAMYGLPINVYADTSNAPIEDNGQTVAIPLLIRNMSDSNVTITKDYIAPAGGFIRLPIDFAGETPYSSDGTLSQIIYGSSVGYIIEDTIPAGETKEYTIYVHSPYYDALSTACSATADPVVCSYFSNITNATTLSEQIKTYLLYQNYEYTMMQKSNASVSIVIPPTIMEGTSITGKVYVYSDGVPTDPDSLVCTYESQDGLIEGNCQTVHVNVGEYAIVGLPNTEGTYLVTVKATFPVVYTVSSTYYTVTKETVPPELIVPTTAIPPGGQALAIYTAGEEQNAPIYYVYSQYGGLLASGEMSFDYTVGVYKAVIQTDMNWGDGQYIVKVVDLDRGLTYFGTFTVDSSIQQILDYVSDINTFLHNTIAAKLDSIQATANNIYAYLNDNIYVKLLDLENQLASIDGTINAFYSEYNNLSAEQLAYLQDINATAYQILQEVEYIKSKIDTEVITKLDQIQYNQQEINSTILDIKLMLDCNEPSAVCLQLDSIQLLIADLNSNLASDTNTIMYKLSDLDSKADTLISYVNTVKSLLKCDSNYPTTSVCAKLDILDLRTQTIEDEVSDLNVFLHRVYDYIQNDLTPEVVHIGSVVEDMNSFLYGDVWNKLTDTYTKVNGLYVEANTIKSLIGDHDAIMRAQLDDILSYLEEVNSTLYTQIADFRNELIPKLDTMQALLDEINANTSYLLSYFNCHQDNNVCNYLESIYGTVTSIKRDTETIIYEVNEAKGIALVQFAEVKDGISDVNSRVQELKVLLDCDLFPTSPVCAKLDAISDKADTIAATIDELNGSLFRLYEEVERQIDQIRNIVGGGGGGGGAGPSTITPVKVVYKSGDVYVALPEYIPPGKYTINYSGNLFRYVKSPEPRTTIELSDNILELELLPNAKGVISGEVQLRAGSRTFRVKLDLVADDRLNQIVAVGSIDDKLMIKIPDGGATVRFRGPISKCVTQKELHIAKGGTYYIKTTCNADGVAEIIPNNRSLSQSTIQISINQRPNIIQATDILHTTIVPIAAFFLFAFLVSHLGLI